MSTHPTTAVVVVNYGSHGLLRANLAGVASSRPDLLVVVVDNFSTSSELTAVQDLCTENAWILVRSPDNVGYGQGNNLGVAAAADRGATRFLLLNPDARIDADSLAALESVVTTNPMTLVAPIIETTDGRVWFDGMFLHLVDGHMRASRKHDPRDSEPVAPWLTGACLMISAELWDRVGGFDPDYFLYWEDVDLSWRCAAAGAELLVLSSARAVHDEGGTQAERGGERVRSNTYYYFNIRNRLLFAARHLDRASRRRWVRFSLSEAYEILKRGGRRQLLRSTGPWRAAARGTIDGMRTMRQPPVGRGSTSLRVLQSFPTPRPTTNPYIVMLAQCLDANPDVDLDTFTWRRALTQRYDVFHAHWPEILVSGRTPIRALARQAMYAVFLARLRRQGTAIVRTLHNLELPNDISRREIALLRLTERQTGLFIRLNDSTHVDRAHATIVHGHYRDWFARYPRAERQRGRFAYFGLIRKYKAVDSLLRAFTSLPADRDDLSLTIGGKPSTDDLRSELEQLAALDPRVTIKLEFLSDEDLVSIASAAELIVLPYREMHNSGGVLAALSLDRPVLSPDNEVNRRLSDEVGCRWVHRFEPPLTPEILLDAIAAVQRERDLAPDGTPNLSARDWSGTAEHHVAAYRRAVTLRRLPTVR